MEDVLGNDQILVGVFSFLDPYGLQLATECCKSWQKVIASHGKLLWLPHTIHNWSTYSVNIPDILSRTIHDRIKSIPAQSIQTFIADFDNGSTGQTYEAAVVKLLFHDHISKRRREQTMLSRYGLPMMMRATLTLFPAWALSLEPHKATFVHSKIDLRRDIYLSELVLIAWEFKFRFSVHEQPVEFTATFERNGTLIINISSFVHQYQAVTVGNRRMIQVDEYPPLISFRHANGSWCLQNAFVTFQQKDTIPSAQLPVLDAPVL